MLLDSKPMEKFKVLYANGADLNWKISEITLLEYLQDRSSNIPQMKEMYVELCYFLEEEHAKKLQLQ